MLVAMAGYIWPKDNREIKVREEEEVVEEMEENERRRKKGRRIMSLAPTSSDMATTTRA